MAEKKKKLTYGNATRMTLPAGGAKEILDVAGALKGVNKKKKKKKKKQ